MIYKLQTVNNYPDDGNHQEVVWQGIFMPFDVVKGLDSLPQDFDSTEFRKTNWWVVPRTRKDHYNVHDISTFIKRIPIKEFSTLDEAISFCLGWRKEWLNNELNKTL